MQAEKAAIKHQLQRDILALQGFKPSLASTAGDLGLGPMTAAFPHAVFPTGAVHEFLSATKEDAAATGGFIAALLGALMRHGGASVWISSSRLLFPPALQAFGIEPDRVIFVDLQKETDILWTMEEALKCGGLAGVVAEIPDISFTASRRLQLAVEQSRVTGFVLRRQPRILQANACVTRWKITPLPSRKYDDLPGVAFPRWNVELVRVRNGKPGTWDIEWMAGKFSFISHRIPSISSAQKKKTG